MSTVKELVPKYSLLEVAEGFKTPAGNSGHGAKLKGQAVPDPPGS